MDLERLTSSLERAALAEIAWIDADGRVRLTSVTPLHLGGEPCLALPLDRLDLARALAASPSVALVLSDSRLAYKGWSPLAVTGRIHALPDPTGELFRERLLEQEVLKNPPARRLIDSPLLRRENWWYLPRVIARLVDIREMRAIARREPGRDGVLAWAGEAGIGVATVPDVEWSAEAIQTGAEGLPERASRAALFTADFSIPDLDRSAELLLRGALDEGRFAVEERIGSLEMEPAPGVGARLRAFRALERACRQGLRDLEDGRPNDLVDV